MRNFSKYMRNIQDCIFAFIEALRLFIMPIAVDLDIVLMVARIGN